MKSNSQSKIYILFLYILYSFVYKQNYYIFYRHANIQRTYLTTNLCSFTHSKTLFLTVVLDFVILALIKI
jgi:hypothetical protein